MSGTKCPPLHQFVDLTEAFDTVNHESLWKTLAKFGCPDNFIAMVQQFDNGMLARVQGNSVYSEPFNVADGEKQVASEPQYFPA